MTSMLLAFGATLFFVMRSVLCITGCLPAPLPPLDASGASPRFPSCDNLECLQTLTNVPGVENSVENHHAEETAPFPSPKPTAALSPWAPQGHHLL